jgi:hypothetical protein
MKLKISNIIFSGILFGLIFCGACSTKSQDAHTHEEGSVCEHHAEKENAMPNQEHFTVEADSMTVDADAIEHNHHNHSH